MNSNASFFPGSNAVVVANPEMAYSLSTRWLIDI
jgi:hypothetical protein